MKRQIIESIEIVLNYYSSGQGGSSWCFFLFTFMGSLDLFHVWKHLKHIHSNWYTMHI